MNSPLFKSLGIELRGTAPRARIAALSVAATEMMYRKRELGYERGARFAFRNDPGFDQRPNWDEYCLREAWLSSDSIHLHALCARAIGRRLDYMKSFGVEIGDLPDLWRNRPSELSDGDLKRMIDGVAGKALFQGESQSDLRRELKIAAAHRNGDRPTISESVRTIITVGRLLGFSGMMSMKRARQIAEYGALDPEERQRLWKEAREKSEQSES